jgi:hypothetical protein
MQRACENLPYVVALLPSCTPLSASIFRRYGASPSRRERLLANASLSLAEGLAAAPGGTRSCASRGRRAEISLVCGLRGGTGLLGEWGLQNTFIAFLKILCDVNRKSREARSDAERCLRIGRPGLCAAARSEMEG